MTKVLAKFGNDKMSYVFCFTVDSTYTLTGTVIEGKKFTILREQVGLNHRKLPRDFLLEL